MGLGSRVRARLKSMACTPLARVALLALQPAARRVRARAPSRARPGRRPTSVSSEGGLSWNETTEPAREAVFRAANRFCAKRKLVMVPVSLDMRPGEGDGPL